MFSILRPLDCGDEVTALEGADGSAR